jgi:hypothetical protein
MSEYYYCAGGSQRPLKEFDFQRENSAGYAWEVRFPGVSEDESWEMDSNPYSNLENAVMAAFPHYKDYGLSIETAAKLCLELGLILGTGVKLDDEEE